MLKIIHYKNLLLMMLAFTLVIYSNVSFSKNCEADSNRVGGVTNYSGTKNYLNIGPNVKKNDRLLVIPFGINNTEMEEYHCYSDSVVHGMIPRYGIEPYPELLEGRQAYYLPDSNRNYAYVFIDNATDQTYPQGSTISLPIVDSTYRIRPASLIIYAAKDNPDTFSSKKRLTVAEVRFTPYENRFVLEYALTSGDLSIVEGPASCSIGSGSDNLTMILPRISTSKFTQIGFPSDNVFATDRINVNCTGKMSAKIKISTNSENINGRNSLIKIDDEGIKNNASGIGFVLSGQFLGDNELISTNEWTSLGDLEYGPSSIELKARYYRYKDKISAGNASASAEFILQFD
ncbi:fimbrial protein [Proteus cibi]|uniref:fimbrial protein n=1 Tax=Proteus cibi TaxID=2050966 RepID=UPI0035A6334F